MFALALTGKRVAVAVLGALALGCSPDLDWRELRSVDGGFAATMPGKPRLEVRTLSGPPSIQMHLWTVRAAHAVFGVGYADYHEMVPEILESTRDALTRNIGGRLLEDAPFLQGGYSGRAFVAAGGNRVLKGRLLLRGRRLYQIVVVSEREALNNADTELFLLSLQLTALRPEDSLRPPE